MRVRPNRAWLLMVGLVLALGAFNGSAEGVEGVTISDGERMAVDGWTRHKVTSPFLGRATCVDVLLPDPLKPGHKYPVLCVLPVGGEWDAQPPWGNGLAEMRKLDAANKYQMICVSMEFDTVPWYGSHATNPLIRHDQYLMQVVVPMVESRYPASAKPEDRWLFGFSKSGWGAVSLLLRHGDFFGRACSWDAPLFEGLTSMRFDMDKHYGTLEQVASYVPANCAKTEAKKFQGGPVRLSILGSDFFDPDGKRYHELLKELSIPHHFDNTLRYRHHWHTGWVAKALEIMLQNDAGAKQNDNKQHRKEKP